MYNKIANEGRKILEDYEKRKKYKILDINNNITIQSFKLKYISSDSLMVSVCIGDIEKKLERADIISMFSYIFLMFCLFISIYVTPIIFVLVMILGIDLVILYRSICRNIAVDKYTQLYNNGYHLTGYIRDNNIIYKINEFFYNRKDMEKYVVKNFGR